MEVNYFLQEIIRREAEWLFTQQLLGGAVVTAYPGGKMIIPYFANLALYGLAACRYYEERIKKYMQWYLSHLEKPDLHGIYGSIYDYRLDSCGREISTGRYDSSDSYGATFLTLARLYIENCGDDTSWLRYCRHEFELIAGAVLATMQKDNLTLARPDWHVKYLMDNCEVYQGLKDYAWLLSTIWEDDLRAAQFTELAGKVKNAVDSKMRVNGSYCPAIYRFGLRKRPNWKKWYPDALAQLFPIITGVVHPSDKISRRLYDGILRNYPRWFENTYPDSYTTTLVAYAAALLGDRWRLRQYVKNLDSNILSRGHIWPYHAAEAGVLILALQHYSGG